MNLEYFIMIAMYEYFVGWKKDGGKKIEIIEFSFLMQFLIASKVYHLSDNYIHSNNWIAYTKFLTGSHIFREWNKIIDVLTNYGTSCSNLVWWDNPPPFIVSYRNND